MRVLLNAVLAAVALLPFQEAWGLSTRSPNPVIKVAANGMSLLKPIFKAEAELQAAVLGKIGGVDKDSVSKEIQKNKRQNKVLVYTYGLSPFSTETKAMLDASGYDYTSIELGPEWFLLGGKGSEARVALSKELGDNGSTSLPKVFIGGKCIGGCSELASIVDEGKLDVLMRKAGAKKIRK